MVAISPIVIPCRTGNSKQPMKDFSDGSRTGPSTLQAV